MTPDADHTHALILAAGFSERMGAFKPLLPLGDSTPLQRLVRMYRRAGVDRVTVVGGHRADEIAAVAAGEGAAFARNPNPENGMFSSVAAGVASLPAGALRAFVHPVDVPLVRTDTITLLLEAAMRTDSTVFVPHFDGRPGHPPLVARAVFADIAAGDGAGGLRAILERRGPTPVPVADRHILFDIDTPADYGEAQRRTADPAGLIPTEARELLHLVFRVTPGVFAHSRAVASAAAALAGVLRESGAPLDSNLAECGAWLHDLAAYADDADALAAVRRRLHDARRVSGRFEDLAGRSLAGLFCSDLERGRECADIILACGATAEAVVEPGFREINLGEWEGLTVAQVEERFPGAYRERGMDMGRYSIAGLNMPAKAIGVGD